MRSEAAAADGKKRYAVGSSGDVGDGGRLVVDIGDVTIGVFRVDGTLYAYENRCPHQGGPVCQGTLLPGVVEVVDSSQISHGFVFNEADPRIVCPWHGYEFGIKTGCHPAQMHVRLRSFPILEEDGVIHVFV